MSTFRIIPDPPNRVFVLITDKVKVRYDRQFNMVEITEGKRTLITTIVPDKYTLNSFLDYVNQVIGVYSRPSVKE